MSLRPLPHPPPRRRPASARRGATVLDAARPDPVETSSIDSFPASDPPAWVWRQRRPA